LDFIGSHFQLVGFVFLGQKPVIKFFASRICKEKKKEKEKKNMQTDKQKQKEVKKCCFKKKAEAPYCYP